MTTKAELEAELADLKREMAQHKDKVKVDLPDATNRDDAQTKSGAEDLKRVLDEHGIDMQMVEALGTNSLEELKEFLKERPLIVLVSVFALGCIVGRAVK